jgi:hypothetical protein
MSTVHMAGEAMARTMNRTRNRTPWIALAAVVPCIVAGRLLGAELAAVDALSAAHGRIVPLVKQYCQDCHSGDVNEGEVDLSGVGSLDAVRHQVKVWQRVAEMVSSRQMPPPEADQPTDKERAEIGQWLHDFLKAEARARAGDPGRVVLRRLNNAEYTYTIRDLAGVDSLDPVKQFPADGGAGEGFTNTGQSLVMSPALVTKYFDAAKAVAGHAVLLPDGFRFSAGDTRRDWADEALARIRGFYGRFTQPLDAAAAAAQKVVKQGITLDAGRDGFLPTEKYLLASLAERDRLAKGADAIAEVARERGLNAKYLATLWATLSSDLSTSDEASASDPSLILDSLRARWRTATPGDAAALAASVAGWQKAVWKFNNVGQIARKLGRPDGPASWMEAVTPLVDRQEFRAKLVVPEGPEAKDAVTIRLDAGDAGDGRDQDVVVWENPRLVAPGRADLPLRLVRQMVATLATQRERLAATASECLAAAAEAAVIEPPVTAESLESTVADLSRKHAVDSQLLSAWLSYLGIGAPEPDVPAADWTAPAGSLLVRWMSAPTEEERETLTAALERLLADGGVDVAKDSPDAELRRMLLSATGPLLARIELDDNAGSAVAVAGSVEASGVGIDPQLFGRPPQGLPADADVDAKDLCVQAPLSIEITIPAELAAGCELVTAGKVHPQSGDDASVQLQVSVGSIADAVSSGLSSSAPVLARKDSVVWQRFHQAFADFRSLFPKAVCYARIVPVDEVVTLNLFYREDEELKRLMLDDAEAKELDRLWNELLFISQEPTELVDVYEQLMGYVSQDRSDLVKSFEPMRGPLEARAAAFRREMTDAEPLQLAQLHAFAALAYRRPLRPDETRELNALYAELRGDDLPHEQAFALTLARVFVAPAFLYKAESPGPGTGPQPVSDAELATRLSYFLWSSLPDAELLETAAAGRLHEPETLLAQTRRMLHDKKARRLAEEFGTQWLHVHGFAEHDEKSEEVFPTFAALRGAMEEETILFLADFLQNDRSILSLLDADHTFLNEDLAKHYSIAGVDGPQWRRVDGVRQHGRGGILGLASTLATQAGASRTSPILRGNWLSEVILGEKLPKPPKNVPLLAETVPDGLTERQLIARHSSDAACAKCHMRIDPFGFALEKYDAIGRFRTQDAAGLPIDAATKLMDGTPIDGPDGLRSYLLNDRRDTFERQFCRKLLGYALGRAVQLSDEPLLDEIQAKLAADGHRVHVLIEAIVSSPQFRDIRGTDAAHDEE